MKFFKGSLISIILLILLFSIGTTFASDLNDLNSTIKQNNEIADNEVISIDEIEVETWEDIQYYSSLDDNNYVLKLKENTNYYPKNTASSDNQIIFNNNITIIGSDGAYIGDSSPNPRNIEYLAMKVPENNGVGIAFKGVTFKWIATRYQPDAIFLQMAGNAVNTFENCFFTDITTTLGHSSIIHIKLGDAIIKNCTFINCTTDFGCLNIQNPNDNPATLCVLARMNVTDCYFERNYAKTAPGCINNCGILVVKNSTFYRNSAFWWAGAIHTTGGANTTLYDSLFLDNVAGWNGGALYTYSYLQIYNTSFINNNCTTGNGGGAIGACKYLHAPYIYVQDSLFQNNENTCWSLSELSSGTGRGGAISIMDEGGIEVRNTTFIKNSASLGTAICAINAGNYGSPDVVIVGNRFINHTRVGDVLDIRISDSSSLLVKDNYYYNNSFEYKKLRLLADEKVGDDVVIHIDAELKNPASFESDILDTTPYDIYVDGTYNKTIIGRQFTLNLKNGKTCNVYAVPLISNSKTNEIFLGVPKEYVYVSQKSGKDTNDGLKRVTPVQSMAKAIELAKTKGNIVIMDGTFNENGFTVDYNLNIIGENDVKFTGSSPNSIFTVTSNDFSISNVTFDSLVFSTKGTGIIRQSSGFTVLENCNFNNNYVTGLSGTNLIEAKNIEIYNSNFTNHNNNGVYITLIKANEFLIENCIFKNNAAYQTTYNALITTTGEKSGVKGTLTDSIFESNIVKDGCVYFGANTVPLTITNTKFIANNVGSTSGQASCIKIENSPEVRIESSMFMDNVNLGTKSAVIYVSGGSASVYVSNSIILNNSYQNTFGLVFSASTASNLKVYKNLDGNWWGNTWENYTIAPAVQTSACSNWLVLNMTSNVTGLAVNQKALVSIDFFNMATREGKLFFRDAGKLPVFNLDINAINGTLSTPKVSIIKGNGAFEYTLESIIGGSVTVYYRNVQSTLNFMWSLIDADIDIDVNNITYGNSTEIAISVPDDIDESRIVLTINNESNDFKRNISLPKLDAGEYLINLTYSGDAKYNPNSYVKSFKVEKANPLINVDVRDVYYGTPVEIEVTADAGGDIAVKINNITNQKAISDGKVIFSIENMLANNYTVEVSYLGDKNHLSKNITANVKVKKYDSEIAISKGDIEIGRDVILTFTLNSDASGIITVDINGKKENVSVVSGSASYTITNISSGFYTIEATYDGDVKYLSSKNTTEIDVGRLTPFLNVTVEDITYTEEAFFNITLNNDASGKVTVNIDGKNYTAAVNEGKASLIISDLTAGDKTAYIKYSGDFRYKDYQTTKSFNIAKAKPTLTVDVADIKEGQSLTVQITITKGTTGVLKIITPKESENADIPRTGLITRTVSDLGVGTYSISVIYAGDDNYCGINETKTFEVTSWSIPQWPNEGYDTKNSEKSPYTSDANGNVAWISDIEGDIIGNMVLDSKGNIYIATSIGIYSIKNTDGSINWIFKSNDAGENFSGIALSRGMVLAPKSGHKLFFINQTTGAALTNNIFQGSSYFPPVVDENANIYITSEYQTTTSSYNLVIVPYNLWEFSTAPTLINIGKFAPTTAPVLINNNTVVVATEDSIKIVDIASKSVSNSFKVTTYVRPVISENILYTIADNSVVAITPDGRMWKVEINGTAGNHLSVGANGEIFSITREGVLYEYSTGEEIFIHDFKTNVSQAILVGEGNNLYVGCENGQFYSLDLEGKVWWKVNLNESLSALPVMDENGMIYFISANRIVAINHADIKDTMISVDVNESYEDDVMIDVDVDSEATGTLSINIGSAYMDESCIENGHASFIISGLTAGTYTAKISYCGDSRFKTEDTEVSFTVLKNSVDCSIEYTNITYGEDLTISISDLPIDATGMITIDINGRKYSNNVSNGKTTITVSDLSAGKYNAEIIYSNDDKYDVESNAIVVEVIKINTAINIMASDIKYGENLQVIINLNKDATGNVRIDVADVSQSAKIAEGSVEFNIFGLACGIHDVIVKYSGDNNYLESQNSTAINVLKVEIPESEVIFPQSDDLTAYSINLPSDATGTLTVVVDGKNYTASVVNGKANINIPELSGGNHNISVIYSGDDRYSPIVKSQIINVPIIELTGKDVSMLYTAGSYYKVCLTQDGSPLADKTVSITINGKIYQRTTDSNGFASVKISLPPKTYSVTATYGNLITSNKVVVKNIINANNVNAKKSAKTVKIKVSLKKVNNKYLKSKTITLKFNKKTFKAKTNKKGLATFTLKNSVYKKLKIGKKYTYQVIYSKNTLKKTIKFKK